MRALEEEITRLTADIDQVRVPPCVSECASVCGRAVRRVMMMMMMMIETKKKSAGTKRVRACS